MNRPTHDEIAQNAESIWQELGRPSDQDVNIWLRAERQLSEPVPTLDEGQSDHTLVEKVATRRMKSMAAQRPRKKAPKAKTPVTGKPLWPQAHSR